MKRIAVIDGDLVAWTVAFYNGADRRTIEEFTHRWMNKTLSKTKTTGAIVCFGDPSRRYFRHDLLETYKAKSAASEQPEGLEIVREILRADFPSRTIPGLEADDVMGIAATHPARTYDPVLVSDDKDLKQIPGVHFNPKKKETFVVNLSAGDRWHMYQTLAGDSHDGYPGLPGIGEVKGEKILADVPAGESVWAAVVAAYELRGLTEDDAILQARLARILRFEDYDFENKRPRLWTPPAVRKAAA